MKSLLFLVISSLSCQSAWSSEWSQLELSVPDSSDEHLSFWKQSRGSRISNGMQQAIGQFPFTARLALLSDAWVICGGSLINNKFVLGARHCANGAVIKSVAVALGSGDWDHPEVEVYVKTFFWYSGSDNADIAMYELHTTVNFNTNIQPVRLPPRSASTYDNVHAYATGWGHTTSGFPRFSQFVAMRVLSNSECQQTYNDNWLDNRRMCAVGLTDSSQGICGGDNGGGLVILETDGQYTIIGINYVPMQDCAAGKASLFTRVSTFLSYINQVTGIPLR